MLTNGRYAGCDVTSIICRYHIIIPHRFGPVFKGRRPRSGTAVASYIMAVNTVCDNPISSPVDGESRVTLANRSCALGSTPVLRTRLHTLDRDFSCQEKGGGNWNLTFMGKRVSDTLWIIHTGIGGEHVYSTNTKLHMSDQVKRRRHQDRCTSDRDIKSKSVDSFQRVTPIEFERETRDLIQRLIKQTDEHYMETRMKIQMIYDQQILLSAQQATIAHELQKEITATMQKRSKDSAVENQLVKEMRKLHGKKNRPQIRLDRYSTLFRSYWKSKMVNLIIQIF